MPPRGWGTTGVLIDGADRVEGADRSRDGNRDGEWNRNTNTVR
jgi:hypothetical protein